MFEKILSSLPYNPSLIDNLSFYFKRIKAEKSIRKAGLIFIILTFFVQFFSFYNPPTTVSADVSNDLISGGFSTQAQAVSDCTNNVGGYQEILAAYSITCNDVANGQTVGGLNSDSYNKQLMSMGRLPYYIVNGAPVVEQNNSTANGTPFPGQTAINISGTPFYTRYLWGWDTGSNVQNGSSYKAIELKSNTGLTYFILYTCGNLVSVGAFPQIPIPITTCPAGSTLVNGACQQSTDCIYQISSENPYACLEFSKTAVNITQNNINANNTTAQPGDIIKYTLSAQNIGNQTLMNYQFQDNINYVLDYSTLYNLGGGQIQNNSEITWPAVDINGNSTISKSFEVKVDNPIPQIGASSNIPTDLILALTNTFGNTVVTHVPQPPLPSQPPATVAMTPPPVSSLPNTGPGTYVFIAAIIFVFAGFFFYRNRLLVKESSIVIKEEAGMI